MPKAAEEVKEETKKTVARTVKPEKVEAPKEKPVAKAGKRSAKAMEEVEQKQAKEERKAEVKAVSEEKPKQKLAAPPTRSRLERRSKGFRKNAEQIDKAKFYTVEEAVKLAKTTSHVKFDATVEVHVRLNVDPRQADQNIRDNVVLPASTGKTIRIAVLTEDAAAAKRAGANIAGIDEIFAALDKGVIEFDTLIATPTLMPQLGKYARVLGPRGLMPNPKSGTVTTDVAKALGEAKAGRVEYRVDSTGIVHLGIGKVSFSETQLQQNLQAVTASIKANKPQSLKGNYVKSIYVSTSMGPSIPVEVSSLN